MNLSDALLAEIEKDIRAQVEGEMAEARETAQRLKANATSDREAARQLIVAAQQKIYEEQETLKKAQRKFELEVQDTRTAIDADSRQMAEQHRLAMDRVKDEEGRLSALATELAERKQRIEEKDAVAERLAKTYRDKLSTLREYLKSV